uniref:Tail fiber protein n=1 Tax=Caulobacter phage BL57 TaxID=3348355 RepID=A0AB74UN95_9VIRU
MSNTPILSIPQVAPNQNQKEDTINTGFAILEAAQNDDVQITVTSGNYSVTADQFTKAFVHRYSGHADATVVAVIPNTARWFALSNEGGFAMGLKVFGQVPVVTIQPGKIVLFQSDGTTLRAVSEGVSRIFDLSDVDGSDTPSNGQTLVWNSTAGQFEPADLPADVDFWTTGTTPSNGVVLRKLFLRPVRFLADFLGSIAKAGVAATGSAAFTVKKTTGVTTTTVGTITFTGTTATFSTDVGAGAVTVNFGVGDIMTITGPASSNSVADIAASLKGVILQ